MLTRDPAAVLTTSIRAGKRSFSSSMCVTTMIRAKSSWIELIASTTSTATLLNLLMLMLFFVANGHITLLRIMMTSGDIVPFGSATLGDAVANRAVELFIECTILSIKLCLPILAAELLSQVGMGILMKVIPQINVFAINIELKVIVGLAMLLLLLSPFSEFLLKVESDMLTEIENILSLTAG